MKGRTFYLCGQCGYKTTKWLGKCPSCGCWGTLTESVEEDTSPVRRRAAKPSGDNPYKKLADVSGGNNQRIVTHNNEFNRVMGGGIVKDSVCIITSPPGGGKSTLALGISNDIANQGMKVLYASGEESESQIKDRANRIFDKISDNIWIVCDTCLNNVLEAAKTIDPDLVVIDSIQTFYLEEYLPSRPGNPTQTMECAGALVGLAKNRNRQRAVIIIGQMNKNDELAGLRSPEHLVDTVLIMDGDADGELRSISATKNRFGSTGEMGFFSMTEKGLISIDNPSEFFITKREKGDEVSGSAITVVKEGSRPIISEIESLVSQSYTTYPSRIGEGFRQDQLNILISVLEQRCGIQLYNKNVVIKATGGMRLKEQAVNMAVVMSIVSSLWDIPIPDNYAFIADIGLTGELKKVPSADSRIRELDRMGFKKVFVAKDAVKNMSYSNIEIVEMKRLDRALAYVFGKVGKMPIKGGKQ